MKKLIFKDLDGDLCEADVNGIDTALPFIQKRIERNMPVETVDSEKLKKHIESMNINCTRALSAKEANVLVATIKRYVINEINKAEKFYVKRGN